MFEWLQNFLSENQFASGGLMLVVLTIAMYTLRRIPRAFIGLAKRRLILQVEILDTDQAFSWFALWLAQQDRIGRSRRLSVVTSVSDTAFQLGAAAVTSGHDVLVTAGVNPSRDAKPEVYFVPAPGLHIIRFDGQWMFVDRSRESGGVPGSSCNGLAMALRQEQFTIRTRFGNREVVRRLIARARDLAMPPEDKNVAIYAARYGEWSLEHRVPPRPISSVILASGLADSILNDLQRFKLNRDWYLARHLPYRRGYLFHGPPGSGKTTTTLALATELGMSIGYVSLLSSDLGDSQFARLLAQSARQNMIVVIEDVDCAFQQRERKEDGVSDKVSYSGLLNSIDGLMSPEGQIVVMTTNHRELLDDALLRPGRVDLDVYFGYADADQATRMIRRFFPDGAKQEAEEQYLALVEDTQTSMADVQQELVRGALPRLTVEDLTNQREQDYGTEATTATEAVAG